MDGGYKLHAKEKVLLCRTFERENENAFI